MYIFNSLTESDTSSFYQTKKATSLLKIAELDLSSPDYDIDPQKNAALMGIVSGFKLHCEKLDLKFTIEAVNRFLGCNDGLVKYSSVVAQLGEIRRRAADELGSRLFLYLDTLKATLFSQEYPLGREIEDRFPDAADDISEAAKCKALGRYTDAVFHFSRVLEFVLNEFHESLTGNPPSPNNTRGQTVATAKVYANQLPTSNNVEKDKI